MKTTPEDRAHLRQVFTRKDKFNGTLNDLLDDFETMESRCVVLEADSAAQSDLITQLMKQTAWKSEMLERAEEYFERMHEEYASIPIDIDMERLKKLIYDLERGPEDSK